MTVFEAWAAPLLIGLAVFVLLLVGWIASEWTRLRAHHRETRWLREAQLHADAQRLRNRRRYG